MRFAKNTIAISPAADEPLLRTIAEAGHVEVGQLFEFICPASRTKPTRDSLLWRLRRLVTQGFLMRNHISGLGCILSLGEQGELYLQGRGGACVDRRIRSRGLNRSNQVWHDVELFGVQVALRRANVVATWRSESAVRAQNEFYSTSYAKEYDAVVGFDVAGITADVALEFERSRKSRDAYRQIFSALRTEHKLSRFLFLVPDSAHQFFLIDAAHGFQLNAFAARTSEFCERPTGALLFALCSGRVLSLAEFLR